MSKTYKLSDGEIRTIKMDDYSEDEFVIASMDFLGCNENSHRIIISEEVFRRCAPSVLGKFLVAEVRYGDATTHTDGEYIQGYVPKEQEVRFIRNSDGCLRGVVDVVISKFYASEFCDIFQTSNNSRSVSVEMMVEEEEEDGEQIIAKNFNIMGVTVLGMTVNPSSPGSNVRITRFTEDTAKQSCEKYYKSVWERLEESDLDKFIKNRKIKLEGKSYSVNTSELKDTPWGDVDKSEIRDAVMNASNRKELVDKVYLKVLAGWEDAPSENLKYPVMELVGDTFYYNRYALASALAYAKQHDEADVVSKVVDLYKKFDLVEEGEEEDMSKKKFEDENRQAWDDIIAEIKEHEGDGAEVESVEEDHIIFTVDDVRYRVDAKVEYSEDDETVRADIDWDTKKEESQEMADEEESAEEDEMAEEPSETETEEEVDAQEDAEEDTEDKEDEMADDESEEDDSEDESEEKSDADRVKELEDIIMAKDAELEELRKYKEKKDGEERDAEVMATLAKIKDYITSETFEALKEEGMSCCLSEIDGWKNKAKSMAFDAGSKDNTVKSMWSMSIPARQVNESTSKWDSI